MNADRFPSEAAFLVERLRTLLAALLLAPGIAAASCFVHPDTGRLHCSSGSDCPAPSAWDSTTLACAVSTTVAPTCVGTDSGTYVPVAEGAFNVAAIQPERAFWTRINAVVSVAGSVWLIPTAGEVGFNMAPPIATRFDDAEGLSGTMAVVHKSQARGVRSLPDTGLARFLLADQVDGANVNVRYTYSYRIAECP